MIKSALRFLLTGAAAVVAAALFATPALAQKTKLTVYTALENDQLGPYKTGLRGRQPRCRDRLGA